MALKLVQESRKRDVLEMMYFRNICRISDILKNSPVRIRCGVRVEYNEKIEMFSSCGNNKRVYQTDVERERERERERDMTV